MMKKLLTAAVIAAAGSIAAPPAQATTITFDDNGVFQGRRVGPIIEQGFKFSHADVYDLIFQQFGLTYSGGRYSGLSTATDTMTKVGGGTFSLQDFYLMKVSLGTTVSVTGYQNGNAVVFKHLLLSMYGSMLL